MTSVPVVGDYPIPVVVSVLRSWFAGIRALVGRFGRLERCCAAIVFGLTAATSVSPAAGAAVAALTIFGPRALRNARASRERRALESQLASTIEIVARRMSTGASFRQAFANATGVSHEPMRSRLERMDRRINHGMAPSRAFDVLCHEVDSDLFDLASHAMTLSARRGGAVVATLRRLARIVRDREMVAEEVRSLTVQGRMSGLIVGLAPVATALAMPEPTGAIPAAINAALTTSGWLMAGVGLVSIWKLSDPDRIMTRGAPVITAESSVRRSRLERAMPDRQPMNAHDFPRRDRMWIASAVLRRAGAIATPVDPRRDRASAVYVKAFGSEPSADTVAELAGLRILAALCGCVLGIVVLGPPTGYLGGIVAAYVGWVYADVGWRRRATTRRREIDAALPNACDMLALNLGAGANLFQALQRTAPLLRGALGDSISTALARVDRGEPLDEALGRVALQLRHNDIDEVVATICEARRCGGPVVAVLDDLAVDMRGRDRLRRQAMARRLPVVILFPLVFLILPAFVLLAIVPMLAGALAGLTG